MASARTLRPTHQTVGNIANVAVSGNAVLQQAATSNRTRVVDATSLVVRGGVGATTQRSEDLLQAVTRGGTHGAVLDHAGDFTGGAGALVEARVSAVVGLHETGVHDTVVGGWGANASVGLLHDDGEDEALVDAGRLGDRLNGGLEVGGFLVGVVFLAEALARLGDDVLQVGCPHAVEVLPLVERRPAFGGLAVAEEGLHVSAAVGDAGAGASRAA